MSAKPSIDSIFCSAIDIESPDDRQALVEQACGEDVDLKHQVERLLHAHFHGRSIFGAPVQSVATVDEPVTETPGTVIGPYKLVQVIGEGGMGTVWMAQQTEPVKRVVALKLIKAGMDSKQVIARFEAERQALAMMDHPNIAKVLDGGETGVRNQESGVRGQDRTASLTPDSCLLTPGSGRPYFVMDLVKGVPITRYCDEHHLTPRQRLELFVPVCQAVQHAHQKGIIHRDLKPSNVLVTLYDGKPVPKVIDFGIAKAAGQSLTDKTLITGFGNIVGTLEYMSPEQAEINQLDIDTRSDIYSLGVLLYELLTGSPPFSRKELEKAGMLEMLRVIREQEPSKPSTKLSTAEGLPTLAANRSTEPAKLTKLVRGDLDWIVMKALEKDRNRRYETANGFALDVQRYLADEPVLACPPSVGYRFRKFARRNKSALVTAALLTIALVTTVVVLAISNFVVGRERDEKTQALLDKGDALKKESAALEKARQQEKLAKENAAKAEVERQAAFHQEQIAKKQELLALRRYYANQMNLAFQAWEKGSLARALDLLESQRPTLDEPDMRTFEWYCLWDLCHRGRRFAVRAHTGWVSAVAFSPDGKSLVSSGTDGIVKLWDVATGQVRAALQGHKGSVHGLAYSPDGKTVASSSHDGTIKLWDVATGQTRATLKGHSNMVWTVAFSPDGSTLASGSHDKTIRLWDMVKGELQATLRGHEFPLGSVAFSPDGKTLASASGWDAIVKVWDVASRRERFTLRGSNPIAFARDGTLACRDMAKAGTTLWDVATGQEKPGRLPGAIPALTMAFSPAGNTLAFGGPDRNVMLWDLALGQARANHGRLTPIQCVAFSPDGTALASGTDDGTLELWETAVRPGPSNLGRTGWIQSAAITRDGKHLFTGAAGVIKRWDMATGAPSGKGLHIEGPVQNAFAVSPDGTMAAVFTTLTIKLWDLTTFQEVGELSGHAEMVRAAAFSPDGKTLASAGQDATVRLWDVASRTARRTLRAPTPMWAVAYSPDGKSLAAGGQEFKVEVWDLATEQQVSLQRDWGGHHLRVGTLAFSSDGKTLAAGGRYGMLKLWDLDSQQNRLSLKGETDSIHALAFSPDNLTLVSGCGDGTVKLWDPRTGQERVMLPGHHQAVFSVLFAAGGKTLVTASKEGMVQFWHAAAHPDATGPKSGPGARDPETPVALPNLDGILPGSDPLKNAALIRPQVPTEAIEDDRNVTGSFFILDPRGAELDRHDTLADALRNVRAGNTIEIRGNGPFVTQPTFVWRALTIRAGKGFRPVIRFTGDVKVIGSDGREVALTCLHATAPLVLEGLEFQRIAEKQSESGFEVMINSWKSTHVANCRFLAKNKNMCLFAAAGEVRNCAFICLDGNSVTTNSYHGGRLLIDNCYHAGGQVSFFGAPGLSEATIRLSRNTLCGRWSRFAFGTGGRKDAKQQGKMVRIEAIGNVFDGPHCMVFVRHADEDERDLPNQVTWQGEQNLYAVSDAFLQLMLFGKKYVYHEPATPVKTLADWRRFWKSPEANSIEGRVRYAGGDLLDRLARDPEQLSPEDFRLRPDSPGYRAGPDGKDLGADVELVGPGAAYERWKKTPEYQKWLKETKQVRSQ